MSTDFHVVSGKAVHRLVHEDVTGCLRVVKEAYLAHHDGRSINPKSHFLRFPARPDARIIALPASLDAPFDVSGIKWIASYPSNLRRGIPRASAVLVLNRTDTGYPFAMLEASVISAARTAASAALAAEAIRGGRRVLRSLGIVGTGLIARYVYRFLLELGWTADRVHLFDADPRESERFAAKVCEAARHRAITIEPDVRQLLRQSELALFATSAGAPWVDEGASLQHQPVILHLSLRDLSPKIIVESQNLVDDVEHVLTAGTSVHLAEQATRGRQFITGTLAGLLRGEVSLAATAPVVFSPFGLGVLDLAVGKWVLDRAVQAGETTLVPDFFFDMSR